MPVDRMEETEHRADGWPLCPRCGNDELFSTMPPIEFIGEPPLSRFFGYRFSCYWCRWTGWIEWPRQRHTCCD